MRPFLLEPATRAFVLALALSGCGIQLGDSGGDSKGCDFLEMPITELDALPEGFERSPRELLEPVEGGVAGRLVLVDGSTHALDFVFAPGPGPFTAVKRLETPGVKGCDADGVTLSGRMTIESSAVQGSDAEVEVRVLDEQIWTSLAGASLLVELEPQFEHPPTSDAELLRPLQRDLDGRWQGEWRWASSYSCGSYACRQEAPLGRFESP